MVALQEKGTSVGGVAYKHVTRSKTWFRQNNALMNRKIPALRTPAK